MASKEEVGPRRTAPSGRSARTTRVNLAEVITQRIRHDIVAGRFQQGERIPEIPLAERYGVSRNPVREAIRRLEAEGLVAVLPNRGATVAVHDFAEATDLLETRLALESLVARQAALRCTVEDITELREITELGTAALRTARGRRLAELNTRFHVRLAKASDNAIAQAFVEQLRDKTTLMYASRVTNNSRAESSWRDHAALVDALESHDPDRAALIIQRHIANAARNLSVRER